MNWKAGDDPEHAHKLNFPNCDFCMRETKDGTLLFHNNTYKNYKYLVFLCKLNV